MANYPASLDTGVSLPTPSTSNNTNNPSHAGLHAAENAAIIAVEGKVGIGATTPASNTLLVGTGAGTSAWQGLTSAQLAAVLSDETGTGSAVFATTPTLITPKVDTINENTLGNGTTIGGVNIKNGALNTNNSVVTSNITDANVTNPKHQNTGTWNSSWAWASYTPTLTNFSGGAITYSKYNQVGKTVSLRFKYIMSGAGMGGGDATVSLPVTANSDYDIEAPIGTGIILDSGINTYSCQVQIVSTTSLRIRVAVASGTYTTIGGSSIISATVPITFGASDAIYLEARYEAA